MHRGAYAPDDYVEQLLASRTQRREREAMAARASASNGYSAAWSPVTRKQPTWTTAAAAAASRAAAPEPESPGAAWAERVRRRHQEGAASTFAAAYNGSAAAAAAPRPPSTLRDALEAKRAELAEARASLQGRSDSAVRRALLRTPPPARPERLERPRHDLADDADDADARWARPRPVVSAGRAQLELVAARLEARGGALEAQLRRGADAERPDVACAAELRLELQRAHNERLDAERRARSLDAELGAARADKAALEAEALDFKHRMEGAVSTFESIVEEAVIEKCDAARIALTAPLAAQRPRRAARGRPVRTVGCALARPSPSAPAAAATAAQVCAAAGDRHSARPACRGQRGGGRGRAARGRRHAHGAHPRGALAARAARRGAARSRRGRARRRRRR
jgi:hypothetical protein